MSELRPLWFDVAYWQKVIDAGAVVAAGGCGVAVRAVVGRLYTDPYFSANWDELKGTVYRTGYGVYVPAQNWLAQLDNWYRVMPERDVIPRVIDLEIQDAAVATRKIADDMWNWVGSIEARDGRKPIIYSRKNLVDAWLVPYWSVSQLNSVWWWLAQYTKGKIVEHPGPPDLPKGVRREQVVLHQTADHKPTPVGVSVSKTIDYDRWTKGNEIEMRLWIQDNWGDEIEPDPEPEPDEILEYRVTVATLNVRSAPSLSATDLGDLRRGDIVTAVDVGGANSWILTQAGWVCKQLNNTRYLEKV